MTQNLNLEDQIESGESELKKLKAEENSLRRLMNVKKEKLATAQFKINKKHEDVKQYKRTVIEYGVAQGRAGTGVTKSFACGSKTRTFQKGVPQGGAGQMSQLWVLGGRVRIWRCCCTGFLSRVTIL